MTSFAAMGTEVLVLAPDLPPTAALRLREDVARVFEAAEARFSRFRPESELSRLNRSAGPTPVSSELFEALLRARSLHDATDGLFDPAIGAALVRAGYDRSWAPGALDRPASTHERRVPRSTFAELVLDRDARTVTRPGEMAIDLGGIVKGRTVDQARALLPPSAALDAGGDAVLLGEGPDGFGWAVDVEDPRDAGHVLATLHLVDAAVATSADNRRAWRVVGKRAHHLVDPRSERPAESDLLQVTAVARSAEIADVLAKVIFIAGAREAARWLARLGGHGAVLVDREGEVHVLGDLCVDDDGVPTAIGAAETEVCDA